MNLKVAVIGCMIGASALAGCTATKAERGALFGGAAGATIGAVATKSAGGAIVGGAIGAATGYVVAKNSYRCWRTNIFGQRYRGWCLR